MSIKILDTFEPAGQFDIARAKDIKYQEDNISVEEKLKQLDNILNAEPTLSYTEGVTGYCPATKVALGENIVLEFNLTSPTTGNCRIIVDRSPFGKNSFTRVKEISEQSGRKIISLGTASVLSDYIYRITVIDRLDRWAKYTRLNEDGTTTVQDYIEFRVTCGGVQFNSTFKDTAKQNIFAQNLLSLNYPFTVNYAVDSYRWLFYSVTPAGVRPAESLADPSWKTIALTLDNNAIIPGSTPIKTSVALDFSSNNYEQNPFAQIGNYNLHVCAAASESEIIDYSTLLTSNIITDTVDILEENSIGVTLIKDLGNGLTDQSYLDIVFMPKTNLPSIQGYLDIKAHCSISNGDYTRDTGENGIACTHTEESIWYIGRLPHSPNPYTLTIECSAPGAKVGTLVVENIYINESKSEGSDYVGKDDGDTSLLFYFDASEQYIENNTWHPVNENAPYKIVTKNLNNTLGIQNTIIGDKELPAFKLAGDAYGMLLKLDNSSEESLTYNQYIPDNPWDVLRTISTSGFTFEAYLRSKCVGTLSARAISMRKDPIGMEILNGQAVNTTNPGCSIGFDTVRADTTKVKTDVPLLEDTWQHITVVVDKDIRTVENNKIRKTDYTTTDQVELAKKPIEDMNPYATLRVYLNGVLVNTSELEPIKDTGDTINDALVAQTLYPLILNGTSESPISSINAGKPEVIQNQGECEIRLMRCYKRGLTSTEVYNNYLNALPEGSSERLAVIARNGEQLTRIYFTKNRTWNQEDQNYWDTKEIENSTFSILNAIQSKYSNNNTRGSKDTFVNCTMHYYLNGEWRHENNVDVYLQGTSSLEYPVKNYQIKVFEVINGKRKKKKILPPFKTAADGWYVADSVYTLKCDYMEQSHRNNTPTAAYYQDRVLDAIIKTQSNSTELDINKYSPPRRITKDVQYQTELGETATIQNVRPYRDAIDGFACIVYYNDNGFNNSNTLNESLSDSNILKDDIYNITVSDSYAGSYMFNVDKDGAQLGFEIGESTDEAIPVIAELQVYDKDGSLRLPKNAKGEEVKLSFNHIPCISYEGATNDNYSAAAFVPWEYCQKEQNKKYFNIGSKYFDENGEELKDKTYEEIEALLDDGVTLYCENAEKGRFKLKSQAEFESEITKYEYLKATLEPRFSFADDFEDDPKVDKQVYNELTYSTLERAIDWVYHTSTDPEKFKNEFSNYFSFEYCLAYYLQMLVFTQTDNAGKNAMFDTWYDGKLYPRPYDMDTQMGLDNSGFDIKSPAAELNLELCPAYISRNQKSEGEFGKPHEYAPTWASTTSHNHIRFDSYNTSESKLWKTFGKVFREEIAQAYRSLRSTSANVYTVEGICDYIDNMTTSVIGEKFYNKDAAIKYLSYVVGEGQNAVYNSKFLRCLQGNRKIRYRQFLEQRLLFLDSVFSTINSPATTSIELRSNVEKDAEIGIHVYSPQYIRVATDSGKQADIFVYADPNDTYKLDGSNELYNGTLLRVPLTGGDKNVLIYGAGNIRAINHTEDLSLTKFDIQNAVKITDINLSGATNLTQLELKNNIYIRNLDISNTSSLRSFINLAGCTNLETVNAAESSLVGITLAPGSNVKRLNLENSSIASLALTSLAQLSARGLNLTKCRNLSELYIDDCVLLENISLNQLKSLAKLRIAGCPYIDTVNLDNLINLSSIELSGSIQDLSFENSAGAAFENLNLTGLPDLKKLNLKGTSVDGSTSNLGRVYLPTNANLSRLNLVGAKITTISWNVSERTEGLYDFTNISFDSKATLSFESNEYFNKIKNLDFTGSLTSLFSKCKKLKKLENCTIKTPETVTEITGMFNECSELTDIGDVKTWNLESIETASTIFYNCTKINYSSIENFLAKLTNVTNLSSFLTLAYSDTTLLGTAGYPKIIYADLLKKNTKLKNISQMFYGTGFEKISNFDKNGNTVTDENGQDIKLFTPCKNTLEDLTGTFASMGKLKYIPKDLFKDCTALKTLKVCFRDAVELGDSTFTPGINDVACIMTSSFDIFNSTNNIENIDGMFFNCKKLDMHVPNEEDSTTLYDFMKPLTRLQSAAATFGWCKKLTHVPEGVFKDNVSLVNIDGTFASTSVTKLPNSLFTTDLTIYKTDYQPSHKVLVSARGLFANCAYLEGIVNKYFFASTPNIARIGNTSGTGINLRNNIRLVIPGMFANTQLTGFHEEFLQPLGDRLIDTSMLFFNSRKEIEPETGKITIYNCGGVLYEGTNSTTLIPAEGNIANFAIYSTKKIDNEGSLTSQDDKKNYDNYDIDKHIFEASTAISKALFENNTKLQTTAAMFAGNNQITEVSKDLFEKLKYDLASTNKGPLTNTSHMFSYCTSLSDCGLTDLLRNIRSLNNVSYMFANCNQLSIDSDTESLSTMFENCESLTNCRAFLLKTSISGNIPATLFNSCRNTLQNVSYMFAGCTSLNGFIETGYAIINDPEVINNNYNNYLLDYFKTRLNAEEKPENFRYTTLDDFETFKNDVKTEIYTDTGNLIDFNTYLSIYKVVDIKQKGLLSDCVALRTADHMFSGCTELSGPIPADMFYFSKTATNKNGTNATITSLKGLFECCYHLTMASPKSSETKTEFGANCVAYKILDESKNQYELVRIKQYGGGNYSEIYPSVKVISNDDIQIGNLNEQQESLVPSDWIKGLTNLTDVSRMFYNVGTLRDASNRIITRPGVTDDFTYSALKIPNSLFANQKELFNLSGAFAFMSATCKSTLTSEFLRNSSKVSDISYLFCGTKLASIGTEYDRVFQKNGTNSALTNVLRAFYSANAISHTYTEAGAQEIKYCYAPSDLDDDFRDLIVKNDLATSFAPEFFNKVKFTKISPSFTGGCFYGTKAQPYYRSDGTANSLVNGGTIESSYTSSENAAITISFFSPPDLAGGGLFNIILSA